MWRAPMRGLSRWLRLSDERHHKALPYRSGPLPHAASEPRAGTRFDGQSGAQHTQPVGSPVTVGTALPLTRYPGGPAPTCRRVVASCDDMEARVPNNPAIACRQTADHVTTSVRHAILAYGAETLGNCPRCLQPVRRSSIFAMWFTADLRWSARQRDPLYGPHRRQGKALIRLGEVV